MVQAQTSARFGLPLSLFTYDADLDLAVESARSTSRRPRGRCSLQGTLSFHYAAGGLDVVKTFSFDSSYVISIDVECNAQW